MMSENVLSVEIDNSSDEYDNWSIADLEAELEKVSEKVNEYRTALKHRLIADAKAAYKSVVNSSKR